MHQGFVEETRRGYCGTLNMSTCRYCKGTGKIRLLFTTVSCECMEAPTEQYKLPPIFADCLGKVGSSSPKALEKPYVKDKFIYATNGHIIVRQPYSGANTSPDKRLDEYLAAVGWDAFKKISGSHNRRACNSCAYVMLPLPKTVMTGKDVILKRSGKRSYKMPYQKWELLWNHHIDRVWPSVLKAYFRTDTYASGPCCADAKFEGVVDVRPL